MPDRSTAGKREDASRSSREVPLVAVLADVTLSSDSRTTAGILLLTFVAVEYGGLFMLRIARGRQPATPFQRSFARAGLALVGQILAEFGRARRRRRLPRPHRDLGGGDSLPGRLLPLVRRRRQNRAEPTAGAPVCGSRLAHRRGRGARHWIDRGVAARTRSRRGQPISSPARDARAPLSESVRDPPLSARELEYIHPTRAEAGARSSPRRLHSLHWAAARRSRGSPRRRRR
jgi:hypothetical protein